MSDKVSDIENTRGYDKFLADASKAVLRLWVNKGGHVPNGTAEQLSQEIISALERIFIEMR